MKYFLLIIMQKNITVIYTKKYAACTLRVCHPIAEDVFFGSDVHPILLANSALKGRVIAGNGRVKAV